MQFILEIHQEVIFIKIRGPLGAIREKLLNGVSG